MSTPILEVVDSSHYRVSGDLVFATVTALAVRARGLFKDASGPVDVDLTAVGRADSAGLALLIEWMAHAEKAGREIHYHGVPAQIRAIAAVSDLDDILPFDD